MSAPPAAVDSWGQPPAPVADFRFDGGTGDSLSHRGERGTKANLSPYPHLLAHDRPHTFLCCLCRQVFGLHIPTAVARRSNRDLSDRWRTGVAIAAAVAAIAAGTAADAVAAVAAVAAGTAADAAIAAVAADTAAAAAVAAVAADTAADAAVAVAAVAAGTAAAAAAAVTVAAHPC